MIIDNQIESAAMELCPHMWEKEEQYWTSGGRRSIVGQVASLPVWVRQLEWVIAGVSGYHHRMEAAGLLSGADPLQRQPFLMDGLSRMGVKLSWR